MDHPKIQKKSKVFLVKSCWQGRCFRPVACQKAWTNPKSMLPGLRLHRNISDRTGLLLLVRIPVDTCHMFTLVVGVAVAAISSSSKNIAVVAATVAAASAVETRYSRNSHLRPTKSRYYNDLFSAPFRASCYNPIG